MAVHQRFRPFAKPPAVCHQGLLQVLPLLGWRIIWADAASQTVTATRRSEFGAREEIQAISRPVANAPGSTYVLVVYDTARVAWYERTAILGPSQRAWADRWMAEIMDTLARCVGEPPAPAQGWYPSHLVPATGMPAWASPDPSRPPVASLGPGVGLAVEQWSGSWALVRAETGWRGWVDSGPLVARR